MSFIFKRSFCFAFSFFAYIFSARKAIVIIKLTDRTVSTIRSFFKSNKELIYILLGYTVIFIVFRFTFVYTVPFLVGFIFAAVMQPVYQYLRKHFRFKSSFSASLATTMIFLILISIICILAVMLINQLFVMFTEIANNNQNINKIIMELWDSLGNVFSKFNFNFLSDKNIMDTLTSGLETVQTFSGYIVSVFSFVPVTVMMIIVSVFATFYFTVNYSKIKSAFKKCMERYNPEKNYVYFSEGKKMIKKFLKGYLSIYGVTFLFSMTFFIVFKVRFAMLFAVLSAVADVLPVLGPSLVYVPLAAVYYLQGDSVTGTAILIGLAIISLVRQFVEPKILSGSISVPSIAGVAAAYFSLLAKSLWLLFYLFMLISAYNNIQKKSSQNQPEEPNDCTPANC